MTTSRSGGLPNTNFWYAEEDPNATGEYRWRPVLQMDGWSMDCDGPWFATQKACEEHIRDEVIVAVGHYEKIEK